MAAPVVSFTVSLPTPYTSGTITDTSSYVSPARSGYGVFMVAQKVDYKGNVTRLTTTGNANPTTASIWTWSATGDGWYQFIYIAAPNYAGGTTYAKYDIVYDPATFVLYQSQQAGNIGHALTLTAWWLPVTNVSGYGVSELYTVYVASLTNPQTATGATISAYNRILYPIAQLAVATQASTKALEGVTDAFRRIDVQGYELLTLFIDAMGSDETAQLFNEGEKIARKSELLISTL